MRSYTKLQRYNQIYNQDKFVFQFANENFHYFKIAILEYIGYYYQTINPYFDFLIDNLELTIEKTYDLNDSMDKLDEMKGKLGKETFERIINIADEIIYNNDNLFVYINNDLFDKNLKRFLKYNYDPEEEFWLFEEEYEISDFEIGDAEYTDSLIEYDLQLTQLTKIKRKFLELERDIKLKMEERKIRKNKIKNRKKLERRKFKKKMKFEEMMKKLKQQQQDEKEDLLVEQIFNHNYIMGMDLNYRNDVTGELQMEDCSSRYLYIDSCFLEESVWYEGFDF